MNSRLVKQLAMRAGYVLGRLVIDPDVQDGYKATVGKLIHNPDWIANNFARDMHQTILDKTGEDVRVQVYGILPTNHLVHFGFTLTEPSSPAGQLDAVVTEEELEKVLPSIGSIMVSPNGFTGQVIAYSADLPRLIKIRWHKFGQNEHKVFDTWENHNNQTVLDAPKSNMWWPSPTDSVPNERPSNVGTPVHTLAYPVEVIELTEDDKAIRRIIDREVEKGKPKVQLQKASQGAGSHRCACGCGGECHNYFCAGHDARCKGQLGRKMAGGEKTWTPTPRLVEYVKGNAAWWDLYGPLIERLEKKE